MTQSHSIIARILAQGPQAPLPGDQLALPVYDYEVVTIAAESTSLQTKDAIQVAHQCADIDDPGFAVGRLRRLELLREVPVRASLLYRSNQSRAELPWYCPKSAAVNDVDQR